MTNILTYKGYTAKIEFSSEDLKLFGKIDGIRDLVTFESVDAETIEQEFHNAVDDYLAYCADKGKEPDKPSQSVFNDIRLALEQAIEYERNKVNDYRPIVSTIETENGTLYVAEFREFEFCGGDGDTPEEAIREAKKNLAIYIEELKEEGKPVPAPLKDDAKGKAAE